MYNCCGAGIACPPDAGVRCNMVMKQLPGEHDGLANNNLTYTLIRYPVTAQKYYKIWLCI